MIEIKHCIPGKVVFTSQTATTVREAVEDAVRNNVSLAYADLCGVDLHRARLRRANLSGANLSLANLRGAYLSFANLRGANLRDAYLNDAYLNDANLADANLSGANLHGAYLDGADLHGVNLSDADLGGADLSGADLSGADLSGADLYLADLSGTNLSGVKGSYAPRIERIHQRILEAVTAEGCSLEMSVWHTCETTHCRAGWVVMLAGEAGKELEKRLGPANAAHLIYRASDPDFDGVDFFCSNEEAMADIVRCAEREKAKKTQP